MTPWRKLETDRFWAEAAAADHVLQFYDHDDMLITTLAGFVGTGLRSEDCIIVIGTDIHLRMLDQELRAHGIDVPSIINDDKYIPLNAEETLGQFMRSGMPDKTLFVETISGIMLRAERKKRRVRAFGEMVAIMWEQSNYTATIQLEAFWNEYMTMKEFSLLCAYPRTFFSKDGSSIGHICNHHSKLLADDCDLKHIVYRDLCS